jgi:hypothetical protein
MEERKRPAKLLSGFYPVPIGGPDGNTWIPETGTPQKPFLKGFLGVGYQTGVRSHPEKAFTDENYLDLWGGLGLGWTRLNHTRRPGTC